ncbi:hypothetical protein QNY05_003823 [Escherichia coli]|uniref:hypothetical protein n=1 Tax=Escherichia coli TaxID=562 RepID=UPI0013B010FF|nr:hypothetical protein [Escherichia coli]EFE7254249.1 hypothetical protein [Escherichia coli]EFH2765686.1 hypothetical protein [Escherichia coli]EFH8447388.1 hypothetical protein [Escherichia coli]EFL9594681.1 hypothetical protein [Escherichia coli]EFM3272055.1 hypothetical protein [Escherichia coli]
MLATTWQPCANNVLNGWQGWWRQCGHPVATVCSHGGDSVVTLWRQCGHPVATVCSHGGDSVALRPMQPHSTYNDSSQ